MGNILDYLDWRGDLTFEQSPFNEVDNLILACFSYLDLDEMAEVKNGNTIRPTISFPVCIASGERNSDIIIPYLIGKASPY